MSQAGAPHAGPVRDRPGPAPDSKFALRRYLHGRTLKEDAVGNKGGQAIWAQSFWPEAMVTETGVESSVSPSPSVEILRSRGRESAPISLQNPRSPIAKSRVAWMFAPTDVGGYYGVAADVSPR